MKKGYPFWVALFSFILTLLKIAVFVGVFFEKTHNLLIYMSSYL